MSPNAVEREGPEGAPADPPSAIQFITENEKLREITSVFNTAMTGITAITLWAQTNDLLIVRQDPKQVILRSMQDECDISAILNAIHTAMRGVRTDESTTPTIELASRRLIWITFQTKQFLLYCVNQLSSQ